MFDAIIYFTDNRRMIIPSALNFRWDAAKHAVIVETGNNGRLFFNMSNVMCIGRTDNMEFLFEPVEI